MRKVENNNKITQNVEQRRFMHNIHESRRRLSSTASVHGDSVCACSLNRYSMTAERIRVNGACYFWPVLLCTRPYPTWIYPAPNLPFFDHTVESAGTSWIRVLQRESAWKRTTLETTKCQTKNVMQEQHRKVDGRKRGEKQAGIAGQCSSTDRLQMASKMFH